MRPVSTDHCRVSSLIDRVTSMRRQLHVEFKFYIHINMLLLQESVCIFQIMVGQEDVHLCDW